jgi:peptide/nickel transport system substrate-binding protein
MRALAPLLLLYWFISCLTVVTVTPCAAQSRELRIGLAAAITSLDPHFHNLSPNNSLSRHMFETLIRQDVNQKLGAGLARNWRAVDALTWEFSLRRNVRFHDGAPFTADDVVFSLQRAGNLPNSPSSFSIFTRALTEVKAIDDFTVLMRTAAPHPLLPYEIAAVPIVSKKVGQNASTDDYNSGKAAVGTGPYRFASYVPNQQVVLKANFGYWGGEEPWETVTFKLLPNAAARVAALLSGDVQVIEAVPTADISALSRNAKIEVVGKISNRLIYLAMEQGFDTAPFVTDKAGRPLTANPFRDARVRRAISLAVSREAIVARIMEDRALAASQILPDGFPGTSKKLRPERADLAQARRLLAEAGYPNGFALTLHASNNRYINDEKIAQALAQMFTRAGIDTKVETMPASVFFSRATKREFGLFMAGWGAETGESAAALKALVASNDPQRGMGTANRGRYSSAPFDKVLNEALVTIDTTAREALLARANEIAFGDLGVIPLHHEISTWAVSKSVTIKARTDQYTLAMEVRPKAGKAP